MSEEVRKLKKQDMFMFLTHSFDSINSPFYSMKNVVFDDYWIEDEDFLLLEKDYQSFLDT